MMGRIDNQMQLLILDLDSMIPENHLLRQIKNSVNFDFIYEKASSFYSHTGRKSIDPVVMIKMLLIGYLYGIKSERRLEEEVSLNLAYRWFCELDLMQKIPDHSTFSQNRRRRFRDNTLFRDIFNEIIMQCINMGIVSGNTVVADGSFLPGNVSVKVMRLRKIWAEGTFSVLKREHNLKRIHKRGIIRAEEECLFSAMALNLKRLVKAM